MDVLITRLTKNLVSILYIFYLVKIHMNIVLSMEQNSSTIWLFSLTNLTNGKLALQVKIRALQSQHALEVL